MTDRFLVISSLWLPLGTVFTEWWVFRKQGPGHEGWWEGGSYDSWKPAESSIFYLVSPFSSTKVDSKLVKMSAVSDGIIFRSSSAPFSTARYAECFADILKALTLAPCVSV